MEELLNKHKHVSLSDAHNLVLVDTCFLLDELLHHHEEELAGLAITSFNCEELVHVTHHLPDHLKKAVRDFLKKKKMTIVTVPVHPGDSVSERLFVKSIDPELLTIIRDPSDAVLLAVALKTQSAVLTKDKHHLFTVSLNNYLNTIRVFKEFKDYKIWALSKH